MPSGIFLSLKFLEDSKAQRGRTKSQQQIKLKTQLKQKEVMFLTCLLQLFALIRDTPIKRKKVKNIYLFSPSARPFHSPVYLPSEILPLQGPSQWCFQTAPALRVTGCVCRGPCVNKASWSHSQGYSKTGGTIANKRTWARARAHTHTEKLNKDVFLLLSITLHLFIIIYSL